MDKSNDVLSLYRLYGLMHGFAHPDQEFMNCHKGNHELLDQYIRLPHCRGLQMNPTRRIGKTLLVKYVQIEVFFPICSYLRFSFLVLPVLRETEQKSQDQRRAPLQKSLLAQVGTWHDFQ
jgi:hypothetical protein